MTTIYKRKEPDYPSPYQALKHQTYNVQSSEHPARREVQKLVGEYTLNATVEEDTQTLATFRHVPGLVAYLCTITRDGAVIGQGRGTATFGPNNKFINRTIKTAFNGSLIDAMIRSTRVLDTLDESTEPHEITPMTDKQRSYLQTLITQRVTGEFELERWSARLGTMSRDEASAAIEELVNR